MGAQDQDGLGVPASEQVVGLSASSPQPSASGLSASIPHAHHHTPEVWEVSETGVVNDAADRTITELTGEDGVNLFHRNGLVALVYERFGERATNGRYTKLVAAAPELLASVKALLDIIHDDLTHARQADHHEALAAANNAVAKATL